MEKSIEAGTPLRRLSLFSSGVGFFEHKGTIDGEVEFTLPFKKDAVNDVLKSIVINDPGASPTVTYHSEDTLSQTLKGLAIDVHGHNDIAAMLNSLKGAEVELHISTPIKGRILLVEYPYVPDSDNTIIEMNDQDTRLSLLTAKGVQIIGLREISGFTFTDPKINADANRALDLIMQSRDSEAKNLTVKLPGTTERQVKLSYVIPTPVWKVSYRLDLSQEKPFLQGWAIVDNDSDTDWEQVELALVTGKPVSFIQNLYAPYHLSRPTMPLAIAGIAKARTYDSGSAMRHYKELAEVKTPSGRGRAIAASGGDILSQCEMDSLLCSMSVDDNEYEPELSVEDLLVSTQLEESEDSNFSMSEGLIETTAGRNAGDQFEFTVKHPVTLPRRQSAMLPLVEGSVNAEKMLVFTGTRYDDKIKNPAIGARIINNTGMKLPAGAITVYDGGTYAGDALIAFMPENETRIISYGEDLSVTGSYTSSSGSITKALSVSGGYMKFKMVRQYKRKYTFMNASGENKRLIVEHHFASSRAELVTPSEYMEKTHELYRFEIQLPPGELIFEVREDEPIAEELYLQNITASDITDYKIFSSDGEIPNGLREMFNRITELRLNINTKQSNLKEFQNKLAGLLTEQERTRKNLAAAGSQTQQGTNYLARLASQDNDIDETHKFIAEAESAVKDAKQIYEKYIQDVVFDEHLIETAEWQ